MMTNVKQAAARATGLFSRKRMEKFHKDEGGVFVVLVLFLLIITYIAVGMAVDVAKTEAKRVRLQAVLDRSILAAADMGNTLDPVDVVHDYFRKAGFPEGTAHPTVVENGTTRRVSGWAATPEDTLFMKLVGVPTILVGAAAEAQESIGNVEISLVLDMSNSMAQSIGTDVKYVSLKKAVIDSFLPGLYGNEALDTTRLSVSIIPYGSQVNLGKGVIKQLWSTYANGDDMYCLDFDDTDYARISIPNESNALAPFNAKLVRSLAANIIDGLDQGGNAGSGTPGFSNQTRSMCPNANFMRVAPFLNDQSQIENVVNSLSASMSNGNYTSINIAAKWGLAFLDPSLADEVALMISDTVDMTGNYDISTTMNGRPSEHNFGDPNVPDGDETIKFLVLMTDGENTYDWNIPDEYHDAMSFVYANSDWTRVDFRITERTAANTPWNVNMRDGDATTNETYYRWICSGCSSGAITGNSRWGTTTSTTNGTMFQKSWKDVFRHYNMTYFSYAVAKMMATSSSSDPSNSTITSRLDRLIPKKGGTNSDSPSWNNYTVPTAAPLPLISGNGIPYPFVDMRYLNEKDTMLDNVCEAAKNEDIIIYTLGFFPANNPLPHAVSVLADCATDSSTTFTAANEDGLSEAFAQIANGIGLLRLTQ